LTLRIERISGRRTNRIRLSGEFRAGQIDQVKAELQSAGSPAILDLGELGLVDVECVHFLNQCEMEGISMLHRSPYIKEWMLRERTAKERKDIMKSTSAESKPAIVFCHGLWADGSCFSKLIVPLQAEGYECIAAQYGLNTTAEDVALVKATMGRVSSPVILVGHSYGGTVITGAGIDDRVVGLVYICALAPDADETSQTQQTKFPTTDVFSYIEVVDGRIWLRPEGTKYFCGDLSEQEQKLVWATQGVPQPDLFDAKAGGTAWKSKPSWYIVGKKDHTVHPDLERAMAKRMGATVYELDSSHVPMLSQPERVIEVIRAAAKGVQASKAKA
jgi:pimeloyl-ACP methyl ester carboxylesterase